MSERVRQPTDLASVSHAYVKHYHTDTMNHSALLVPKHNEAQEEYRPLHSNPYTNYVVASGSNDPRIAVSFLQCLAHWSYDTPRIAIFENTMKTRFSQGDSDITEMWEMIVDSQTFDLGRIFRNFLRRSGLILVNMFNGKLQDKRSDWQNIMDFYEQELKDLVTALNTMLRGLSQE